MDEKRLEEIRNEASVIDVDPFDSPGLYRITRILVPELIEALEEARREVERLREAIGDGKPFRYVKKEDG